MKLVILLTPVRLSCRQLCKLFADALAYGSADQTVLVEEDPHHHPLFQLMTSPLWHDLLLTSSVHH